MTSRISKNIYIAKFFAIISVICAHCGGVNLTYSSINIFSARILSSFGSVGVGVFLFISGYLLYTSNRDFKSFIKSKLLYLMVPWLFCGSLVYLYITIRKGSLDITDWIRWLLGVDTYLYYMTILICCYLLCYFIRKSIIACYLLLLLAALSNFMTALGYLDCVSSYLNPFNFLFFFVCGLLCGRINLEKFFDIARRVAVYVITAYFITIVLLSYYDMPITYFVIYYIPIELLAILGILGLSDMFNKHCHCAIVDIGKQSFSIYLLHMPVAGIVANLFNRVDFFLLTLIRPVVVLLITYLTIKALLLIMNRASISKMKTLIGAK